MILSAPSHVHGTIVHDIIPGMWKDVYVAEGTLGKGLFTAGKFLKGQRIGVFEGPIIDFAAAVKKGDKQCYPLQIANDQYIDLTEPGCFANHSCEPNAGIKNDIELVALTNIPEGTEIRYDYSTTMDEDFFTMPCRCGSSTCRSVVTDFKLLSPALQNKYIRLGLVMSFIIHRMPHPSGNGSKPVSAASQNSSP